MAGFDLTATIGIKNENKFVDTRFAPIAEPNLFDNSVLIPNVTFTSKYQLDSAGQIVVHKAGLGTIGTAAAFSHIDVADTQIIINRDERYNFSRIIYGDVEAATGMATAVNEMETGMQGIAETWQAAVMANVVANAGETSVLGTTAIDKDNVYNSMIDDRALLVSNKARVANIVAVVSPAVYGSMLKADLLVANASVGTLGATAPALGNLIVLEYQGFAATVDYVMYDSETLSVVPLLEAMRLKDTPDFIGSLAQGAVTSGTKVTNEDIALVKLNA